MLTIIIFAILGLFLGVHIEYRDFLNYRKTRWGAGLFIGLFVGIFIAGNIGYLGTPYQREEIINLVSLRDEFGSSGHSYFLGGTSIEGKVHYVYYVELNRDVFQAREEERKDGIMIKRYSGPGNDYPQLWGFNFGEDVYRIEFHIPKGSIRSGFSI